MSQRTLTTDEATMISKILNEGRARRASISALAAAYELSVAGGLRGTADELAALIREKVPTPAYHRTSRDVLLGVTTGALTHYLLRGV